MKTRLCGLFCPPGKSTASFGRVGFWLTYGLAVFFWLSRPVDAFPETLWQTLLSFIIYNLGSKAVLAWGAKAPKE